MRSQVLLREGAGSAKVTVHMGTCGIASGAREILKTFLALKEKADATDTLVTTSGCAGLCSNEPMATVELKNKAPVKYIDLTSEKVQKIFTDHVLGGNIVVAYALAVGSERMS